MKAGATDDLISELECGLINVALASRYSPDRWQNFLHVMILKIRDYGTILPSNHLLVPS